MIMDEININEEILARLNENRLEALLQERIIQSFTEKSFQHIQSIINRHIFDFAEKTKQSVYDICINYVPKVKFRTTENNPEKEGIFSQMYIEWIHVNELKYGQGKNK